MTKHEGALESAFSHQLAGKLLLRNELPLDDKQFEQFLADGALMPIPSIEKQLFSAICQRCGNRKKYLFGILPCKQCDKTHLYCRKCIEMGRVMECEPLYYWNGKKVVWPIIDKPCTWEGELTALQQKASDRIVSAITNKEEELLVWAVCGAGKTEMLFPGIAEALRSGMRVCLATPRADVVQELLPRIRNAFKNVNIQGLYGGSEEKTGNAQLIISTTHQLLRFKAAFHLLIIDEVDAFPFHNDPSLPYAAKRSLHSTQSTTVFLTATPRRNQQFRLWMKQLPHVFVPARFHGHPLPVPILKTCTSLKKDTQANRVPDVLLNWMKKRSSPHRQLLLFVPTIELVEQLYKNSIAQFLQQKLLESKDKIMCVHASDPLRKEKVQLFRDKKIDILITTTTLERGVTFPSVDVAILDAGHRVFDEAALVQIAGRAGRSPDDPKGEVVFFHNGKTNAMVHAIDAIKSMNKRGGFI
ncbi:DEAD/DEAH box helicase [Virgibacillus sp. SK37]|uniref:DEAD/DEAH box helicase n=1 Tax=Virgibacillus sp. SK37 TaxID=403957 RepID=UPI0004D18FE3|nr:DEAD/DEAH box helicase [Virgibacillus sp. SK37]AIF44164.1 competence protein ComF [Virgibacillus sp. SK37]